MKPRLMMLKIVDLLAVCLVCCCTLVQALLAALVPSQRPGKEARHRHRRQSRLADRAA